MQLTILLKLLANGIVVVPGLLWSGTSLMFAIVSSLVLSLVAYVLGDLVILPKTNNTYASTADLLLSFALLWVLCTIFYQTFSLAGLFVTAFALSIVEFFYHDYLQREGTHHSKHPG